MKTILATMIAIGALNVDFAAAASDTPTVVMVHGAFADGSSWNKVISLLQAKSIKAVAVQNPLSSLEDDVAATNRILDAQTGPVVLVGHSWAGSVITQAGGHEKVKALVYVASFAPALGETSVDAIRAYPTPPGVAHFVAGRTGTSLCRRKRLPRSSHRI